MCISQRFQESVCVGGDTIKLQVAIGVKYIRSRISVQMSSKSVQGARMVPRKEKIWLRIYACTPWHLDQTVECIREGYCRRFPSIYREPGIGTGQVSAHIARKAENIQLTI